MPSLSFDPMVELYDQTRTFDATCFAAALDFLVARFPPPTYLELFEPGIGTGRIAIPLAQRGYCVTGVDLSPAMLARLAQRLAACPPPVTVSAQLGDVTALPYTDATFDWAIAVHLFYFVADWRQAVREVLRVLKLGGPLVLMHTGRGAEVPFLTDLYKERCAARGCSCAYPGAASTAAVAEYLTGLGYAQEDLRERWAWTTRIRLDQALAQMQARAYSYMSHPPAELHDAVMAELAVETARRYPSLAREIEVPNEIRLSIFTPRGAPEGARK